MTRHRPTIVSLQLAACVLGMLAGLVPGVSWTGLFTGMDYMSGGFAVAADDERVRVTGVEPGSPAERAGFRAGDVIEAPKDFDSVQAAAKAVRHGEPQVFRIQREESEVKIEAARTKPEIAAIWYAHVWYPIAAAVFLCFGMLLLMTGRLDPAPLWRSVAAIAIGLSVATGFAFDAVHGTVFNRFRIYQRWPMGTGNDWYVHQGLIGIAAGVLLAMFAAAEFRRRIAARPQRGLSG